MVELKIYGKTRTVRALIDSGSQQSYRYPKKYCDWDRLQTMKPDDKENLIHSLLGGVKTNSVHYRYIIPVFSIQNDYMCEMSVLDQLLSAGCYPD